MGGGYCGWVWDCGGHDIQDGADCRPAADVSRLMSGLEGAVVCCSVRETMSSHAGWRGVLMAVGFWKRLLAWESVLWNSGGDFVPVRLRFSAHQDARSDWWVLESGKRSRASWVSQRTIAKVRLYGVKPNGDLVPGWIR